MIRILIAFIHFYQHTLSPDHGILRIRYPYGFCRFSPTCSSYAIEALARYGLRRGIVHSIKRVLRCNPWHAMKYDPVQSIPVRNKA